MSHRYDSLNPQDLWKKPCGKWQSKPKDALPLWVADMDFPVADAIKEAIIEHVGSDNFGYPEYEGLPGLKTAVMERMAARYHWQLEPKDIYPINGIVPGLFLGVESCTSIAEDVILQEPIYGPFTMAINETQRRPIYNRFVHDGTHWRIDFERLEQQITPATRLLMICNPQNPTGRVFTREELERLADFALRHRLWIVSDELHSDLIYSGQEHIPFASLSKEVAERTITLFGPTKTFNIAGLKLGFLVTQNPELMKHVKKLASGRIGPPNTLAQSATIAAYRKGDSWLKDTLAYLEANRDFVAEFLARELPDIHHSSPEGTYLAWLDFKHYDLGNVESFILEKARVAINSGTFFGPENESFGRLNFATSRAILEEALFRIRDALTREAKRGTYVA